MERNVGPNSLKKVELENHFFGVLTLVTHSIVTLILVLYSAVPKIAYMRKLENR